MSVDCAIQGRYKTLEYASNFGAHNLMGVKSVLINTNR